MAPGARPDSALERGYPAVMRAITLLWGYPELNQYFQKIAAGIDLHLNLEPDAMAEAMLLAAIHRRICAATPAKSVEELYGPGRWADPWKTSRPRR